MCVSILNGTNGTNASGSGNNTTLLCLQAFEFFAVTGMSSNIFFDDVVAGELGLGFDLPDNGPSFVS